MSKITKNFEALVEAKHIPFSKEEIQQGHSLYRVSFKISEIN